MMETLEVLRERCDKEIVIRVLPTLYDTRTKLAREVLSELRSKFREYLMESTVNFNTKLKEAASFGQPITEYDPGSRGYKDFVNLARELMGHRPMDIEPAPVERLSRPAELVKRAKQLSQLANYQFGRGSVPTTVSAPAEPQQQTAVASAEPMLAGRLAIHSADPLVAELSSATAAQPRLRFDEELPPQQTPAAAPKTLEQKLEEFYGVKQENGQTLFATHFNDAKQVLIAGDFNNWSPMSTPMVAGSKPGDWTAKLPLRQGRYRYRFIVDGKWLSDPHNTYVETNQFGELNNVVDVE
jgi:hypothetical protein